VVVVEVVAADLELDLELELDLVLAGVLSVCALNAARY